MEQHNLKVAGTLKRGTRVNLKIHRDEENTVLEAYRAHVAERAELGIPPKPLNAEQTAALVELLKTPPAGEETTPKKKQFNCWV